MKIATRFGLFFCIAVSSYAQVSGRWEFNVTIAEGADQCIIELSEIDGHVKGTYSGLLGQDKPVKGTYYDHKLSLRFSGDWPTDGTSAHVTLDGSISGDSGSGNVIIADRGDGTWTASRAKQADALPGAKGAATDAGSISRVASAISSDKERVRQEPTGKFSVIDPPWKSGARDFATSN